jgi:hypothetical protein
VKARRNTRLLACPFCGAKGRARECDPMPPELPRTWWTVRCSRDTRYHHSRGIGCPVGPLATGDTLAEVVAKWNTRQNERSG